MRFIVRHRRWVLAGWALALAAAAPAAARVERALDVSARVEGSESAAVERMLRERFDSPFARYAVLVATGLPPAGTPPGDSAVRRIVRELRTLPAITATLSFLDGRDSLFAPAGGGTFVVVGFEAPDGKPDRVVAPLRESSARLLPELRARWPQAMLRWTGEEMLNHDLRETSAAQARSAEQRALPLTLALLLVAFGALVAALVPVASGLLAITLALGATALVAALVPLSILVQNVVTMIGLGLGIDYALLMVSRFREELRAGYDAPTAAIRAGDAAGHTILLSGASVLIGFAALLPIPLNELRSVAVGGALVVAFSTLVGTTLLPALLAAMGERVNAVRVTRWRPGFTVRQWERWGAWVVRRPLVVLVVATAPLMALALQAPRMRTTLPRVRWIPADMEAGRALDDLERMDRAGIVQALRVVLELPPDRSVVGDDGWRAVRALGDSLAADARVSTVQSLPRLTGLQRPDLSVLASLPRDAWPTFVSRDQRVAVVEVLPRSEVDFPSLTVLARELRRLDAAAITGIPGARIRVGGMPAFNADYEDAIAGRLTMVVALVLGGTFVALMIGFRSLLIPLKALTLNALSVAAAFGAVVLVFQDGHGARWLGVAEPMGSLFPSLPILVFCMVFGLSMDYEVFLLARVADARRAGADESTAIAHALGRTGGVITSAAAIMVAVFGAFMLGDFLIFEVLGVALATAVLFDATVVRVAIGPALLGLAGRWNWWPGESMARRPRLRRGVRVPGDSRVA